MAESLFPRTISGFIEYIKVAYAKAQTNLSKYDITALRFQTVTPLYSSYIQLEAVTANPETATKGARRARDEAKLELEKEWRDFLNECIRYNSLVPVSDLETFRIKKRDTVRTPVDVPSVPANIVARIVSSRNIEIEVLNGETSKKKKPKNAAGSFIYLAITEANQMPVHDSEYHKLDFSSNCHHSVTFSLEQLAKQANFFARYANSHGKEGPEGAVESIIIS
jgi:hypothetical protein